jgi:hypothetical protein
VKNAVNLFKESDAGILPFPTTVVNAGRIWTFSDRRLKKFADMFSSIRITSPSIQIEDINTANIPPVVTNFEKRRLDGKISVKGIIYDGFLYAWIVMEALKTRKRLTKNSVDVVLTDQLIATFGEDGRYHLRVCVLWNPHIISIPGIFDAPAKPPEYHISKMISQDAFYLYGREIVKQPTGNILASIISSYILNAVVYQVLGEGFCPRRTCKLSDPHYLQDMKYKASGNLCKGHLFVQKTLNGEF